MPDKTEVCNFLSKVGSNKLPSWAIYVASSEPRTARAHERWKVLDSAEADAGGAHLRESSTGVICDSFTDAGSLTIVYPLDYARTYLVPDAGSGKKTFDRLFDCL